MPAKNHLVFEALLCVVCLPIPPLPAANFFSSCHSILASLVTFLRKSAVWLCPGHTMICLCTWALFPWLVHSILEWDLENHWMCHSSWVCMEAVVSYLSLTWHCSGWQNWEGKGFFLFSGEQSELSLACCRNRVHLWDNALTREERLLTRHEKCLTVALPIQCFCFSVIHHPNVELSISWGGVQRKGVKGQAKIFLTVLWYSLLWMLWAKGPCKSLPAEPNPEPEELPATGRFTLGQLFSRSSWNEHKETTIHRDPAGKTVVPHTGNLNVVKCSSSFTPCPKMAV